MTVFWAVLGVLWAVCAVVVLATLAWSSRHDPACSDPLAEVVAIGQENDPHPEATLQEAIQVARLLIEISREIDRYRDGVDITAGAPKEWTP